MDRPSSCFALITSDYYARLCQVTLGKGGVETIHGLGDITAVEQVMEDPQ